MRTFISYNEHFNTLFVTFKNGCVNENITKDNITILKCDGEIVGLNIFNPKLELKNGMYSEDEKVQEYILEVANEFVPENSFEPQFIVGKIIECTDIPDTHLHLCKVDIKSEILQIVCGAPNAKEGLSVVVATVGSFMPNGMQITEGKLRGFDSFGMLCSARELGIEKGIFNDTGIIELDANKFKTGEAFWKVMKK